MTESAHDWESQCEHVKLLRLYATFTILFGIAGLFMLYAIRGASESGGRDISAILYPAGYCILIGLGGTLGYKFTAVILGVSIGAIGLWLGIGSLLSLRDTLWVLLNIPVAALCLLPMWSTIRGWQALK